MGHFTSSLMLFAQQSVIQGRPPLEEAPLLSPWIMGGLVLAVLGLPLLLGSLIARWLKMKDLSTKFGVILLAGVLGLSPFVSEYFKEILENRKYDTDMAVWQKKQDARDKITDTGVEELEKAVRDVTIHRHKKVAVSQ